MLLEVWTKNRKNLAVSKNSFITDGVNVNSWRTRDNKHRLQQHRVECSVIILDSALTDLKYIYNRRKETLIKCGSSGCRFILFACVLLLVSLCPFFVLKVFVFYLIDWLIESEWVTDWVSLFVYLFVYVLVRLYCLCVCFLKIIWLLNC